MFRTVTLTALFALGLTTAAQAAPAMDLNSRIQQAAESVCTPLVGPRTTSLLYKRWYADCVTNANTRITAAVVASQGTSTALLSK